MAQRDIEAIAEQMQMEEEYQQECDRAYAQAQAEEEQFEKEEFDALEDEIIDPAVVGFIDSEAEDKTDESDPMYNEDDDLDGNLDEDVSDCMEVEEVDEAEDQCSIEVEVYNEDGFGKHFVAEVMKNVPGVVAVAKKTPASNGDIVVKISGSRPDLEKAYAFYVGQKDFMLLPKDDREEFESLLVFDDGDTLAEADYREAVAHCLDPIGVDASTANLAAQDTCAISMIKEERAKRRAKKMLKALHENDYEELSDEDLAQLEKISDIAQSEVGQDGMTDDERRTWNAMLKTLGYTQEEWDKLTPKQREDAMKADAEKLSTSYKFLRTSNMADKEKKRQDALDKAEKAIEAGTWSLADFNDAISALSPKQRKALMNELIDEVKDEAKDPQQASNEILAIKTMFDNVTFRDIASSWKKSPVGVFRVKRDVEEALFIALKKTLGRPISSTGEIKHVLMSTPLKNKFMKVFAQELNLKKAAAHPSDPERNEKRMQFLKMLKDMGFTPATWQKLSLDDQLRLTDEYNASEAKAQ